MGFIKRISKILDSQLTKIETELENKDSDIFNSKKENNEFKNNLDKKAVNSKSRINSVRKSIQNTKQ